MRRPFKPQVEADTGRAQREISRISAALRRFGATRAEAIADVKVRGLSQLAAARSQVRAFGAESAQASGGVERLNTVTGGINQRFSLVRNLLRVGIFTAVTAGVGALIQALSSAAAGAAGLLGSLVPLSGVLAAYPAALAVAAQGARVWTLAMGGIRRCSAASATSSTVRRSTDGANPLCGAHRLRPALAARRRRGQRSAVPRR